MTGLKLHFFQFQLICGTILSMSKTTTNLNPVPEGLTLISAENPGTKPLKLQLTDLKGTVIKEIPFDEKNNIGTVSNMALTDIDIRKTGYRLRSGGEVFMDPYCCHVSGDEKWGKYTPFGRFDPCPLTEVSYTKEPKKFSDLVIYYLHVRGFTKSRNSGVAYPGTFEGVIEKTDHFRSLGVNALELMPVYDFNEIMEEKTPETQEEAKKEAGILKGKKKRLNYWGFTGGNYFVPKNSYSAKGDGVRSFKEMISALHNEGIEVIVDFFFEEDLTSRFIVDVLRYWVIDYGVDGFALFGSDIPSEDILRDPYLKNSKFIFENRPGEHCLKYLNEDRAERIAVLNSDFLYDNRRFLKSDGNMLSRFTRHLVEEGDYGLINYMSSFNTMTMNDMVSFDRKHNEENGENNTDGTDLNYSWNCGVEGRSRKKAVMTLRERQIKNAFIYLILSRGTPRICMGDEFRNSQKGNNNPYCLDNSVTWLDWEDLNKNKEIFDFVKSMIGLRLQCPVFRRAVKKEKGAFPETSFHGESAWAANYFDYCRHIGVLYSDKSLYYCAYNMHWQEQKLALPNLSKNKKWKRLLCTNNEKEPVMDAGFLLVPPRSVCVLRAD